jgi:hypothetical protein
MFRTSRLLDPRFAESRKADEVAYRDFSRKLRSLPRVLNRWTARFASGISLERNPITCSQVSRFSESRYADGAFLFGTFSESPDLRHASGRDERLRSDRDFAYRDFSRVAMSSFFDKLKPRMPKCRRALRCSPRVRTNGRLRSYRYIAYRDFASCEVPLQWSLKTPNSEMPI